MPIYEYECTVCGQIDEVVQKMSDEPLTQCRHCSGGLKKLISHSTFHLKGGGWYADNYGTKPVNDSKPSKTTSSSTAAESKSNTDS